jgi:hypothetical protein
MNLGTSLEMGTLLEEPTFIKIKKSLKVRWGHRMTGLACLSFTHQFPELCARTGHLVCITTHGTEAGWIAQERGNCMAAGGNATAEMPYSRTCVTTQTVTNKTLPELVGTSMVH